MKLGKLQNGNRWYYNSKLIQWIIPEHCLLLVGYDDEHYIFNDPLRSKQTYYRKSAVEIAYAGLFKQAIVIENRRVIYEYKRPSIPTVLNGTKTIQSLINDIYTLEERYVEYHKLTGGTGYPSKELNSYQVVISITNFLRRHDYNGYEWFFTTGYAIDTIFASYVKNKDIELYNQLEPYIKQEKRTLLSGID